MHTQFFGNFFEFSKKRGWRDHLYIRREAFLDKKEKQKSFQHFEKRLDKRGKFMYNSLCEFCKGRSQVHGEVLKRPKRRPC